MSITQFFHNLYNYKILLKNIQEDMTNFWLKLASILLTSELNKASWLRAADQQDDGSTSYKRKRTPSPMKNNNEDGLSEEIDNKKVIYIYPHIIYICNNFINYIVRNFFNYIAYLY
jgi:hypothetical protein